MSFSLNISGHVPDDETATKVDELVLAIGKDVVDKLRELGVEPTYATYAGPTASENYLLTSVSEDEPGEAPSDDG